MYTSDKRLKNIFNSIGDGVITVNMDRKIDFINEVACELTGWDHDEALGQDFKSIFDLSNKLEDFPNNCLLDQAIKTKKKQGLGKTNQLNAKNGRKYYISASIAPILCDGCKDGIDGVVVVFRDITEIKKMEATINKERDNFKLAFNNIPLSSLIVDENRKIIEVNDVFLKEFNISEKDLINSSLGRGLGCVFSNDNTCGFGEDGYNCQIKKAIDEALISGLPKTKEIIKRRLNYPISNRENWYRISYIPLSLQEKRNLLMTIEDITDYIDYQNKLKESKEIAEAANQSKTDFLANMSHEIKTPLNGLIGMIDLTRLSKLDEEQEENLLIAKSCANSLLNIVEDILDFSKIEAGVLEIQNTPFNLSSIMVSVEKTHGIAAKEKNLDLVIINKLGNQVDLFGDPYRLTQVLNNLLNNAIKFTEKGRVTLELGGKERTDSLDLIFNIMDTGLGISEKDQENIFSRFVQAESHLNKEHKGTGLGLAITKELVDAMGGEISLKSRPGEGSCFTVKLSFSKVNGLKDNRMMI